MARRWDFKGYKRRLRRAKRDVVRKVAKEAVNHFKTSFKLKRFNDRGARAWKGRKSNRHKHPLLEQSGRLRNSIRAVSKTFRRIVIRAVGVEYSKIQNRGSDAVGASHKNIPSRRFMGKSTLLSAKIRKIIDKEVKRIFR